MINREQDHCALCPSPLPRSGWARHLREDGTTYEVCHSCHQLILAVEKVFGRVSPM